MRTQSHSNSKKVVAAVFVLIVLIIRVADLITLVVAVITAAVMMALQCEMTGNSG